jgi:hypothetical protein
MARSRDVRYQANQEQYDEDEETNSGNLSRGERYHPKTEGAGYQCDYEEHQRVIQHGDSFLFRVKPAGNIQSNPCARAKHTVLNRKFSGRRTWFAEMRRLRL